MAKRKRVSGEGTYKKRKDGRWEARFTIHTPSGYQAQERLRPYEE